MKLRVSAASVKLILFAASCTTPARSVRPVPPVSVPRTTAARSPVLPVSVPRDVSGLRIERDVTAGRPWYRLHNGTTDLAFRGTGNGHSFTGAVMPGPEGPVGVCGTVTPPQPWLQPGETAHAGEGPLMGMPDLLPGRYSFSLRVISLPVDGSGRAQDHVLHDEFTIPDQGSRR